MRQAAGELNSKRLLPLGDCRARSLCPRPAAVSAGLSTTADRGGGGGCFYKRRSAGEDFKDEEVEGASEVEDGSEAGEDSEVREDSEVGEDSEVKEDSKNLSRSLTVTSGLQIRCLSLNSPALHL